MLSSKINEITDKLSKHNISASQAIELEAKFGFFSKKYNPKKRREETRFESGVPYVYFERLLNYLRKTPTIGNEHVEVSNVEIMGDVRRIAIINQGDNPEQIIWQRKSKLENIESYDYDIRISISEEENISPPQKFLAEYTRYRTRYSFMLENGQIKIDQTEVMSKDDTTNKRDYEIEIEYLGDKTNIKLFTDYIEKIFKIIRGTYFTYTNITKNELINDVSAILGTFKDGYPKIDSSVLVQARNIKLKDLVYGGIVGNPETSYLVTFKADGLRKMLIIHKTGIWLVYPPYEYNFVLDLNAKNTNYTDDLIKLGVMLQDFDGTILDGELVVPKETSQYGNVSYYYKAFDCISLKGVGTQIQQYPYLERQKFVIEITKLFMNVFNGMNKIFKDSILFVDTKETKELKTTDDFFTYVREFLDKRETLDYTEDGLMFIPQNEIYNPRSQKHDISKRVLTKIPDTCKWKDQRDITIDFSIKWIRDGKTLDLESYDEAKKVMVSFRGSPKYPFTIDMIDHTNKLTLGKPTGSIFEYEFVKPKNAYIRFINATAITPSLNFYAKNPNGDYTSIFLNIEYTKSSSYVPVQLGTVPIRIETSKTGVELISTNITLVRGCIYTIITTDSNLSIIVLRDNTNNCEELQKDFDTQAYTGKWYQSQPFEALYADSTIQLRILHNIVNAPPVAIYIDDKLFIERLDYKSTTAYLNVPKSEKQYKVRIDVIGTDLSLSSKIDLSNNNQYTLFIAGLVSDPKTFQTLLFKDDLKCPTGPIMTPRKPRRDKQSANKLDIALANWDDIMDPVTEQDITGRNLSAAFIYHNKLKYYLYEKLRNGSNILDIGSGRGGDINKWKPLGLIVAVEPNESNREELERRILAKAITKNVDVVPVGGEDTETIRNEVIKMIPDGKVDAVTLMLSMSFFWSTTTHLDALIKTMVTNIKSNGKIIFLTIDGDSLEQLFEPAFSEIWHTDKKISIADIHLYKNTLPPYGRPVDFVLPNTIVGAQREYVVHVDDLTQRLSQYGFELQEYRRAEHTDAFNEPLLSKENKVFTSLYSYGVYVNVDPSKLQAEPTNISLLEIPLPIDQKAEVVEGVEVVEEMFEKVVEKVVEEEKIVEEKDMDTPKIDIEHKTLPSLSVQLANEPKPAKNDDTYAPLKCTWYNNLVRISTIGDGSCLIHSILKAFYKPYQENDDEMYRTQLAKELRRDLAFLLNYENPEYPNHTYWESSGRGAFPRIMMQQLANESLVQELKVDFSLSGLQRLFNSYSYLGDEVYQYISDVLDVDIYILRATSEDIFPHINTRNPKISRNGIVIVGNSYHYEVVAVETNGEFQTTFPPNDPFILALINVFIGDGGFNDSIPFDPEEEFIKNAVETFTTGDEFKLPDDLMEIFTEEDLFITLLSDMSDRIVEAAKIKIQQGQEQDRPPELLQLEQTFYKLKEKGYTDDEMINIYNIIKILIDPNVKKDLDYYLATAETKSLLSHDTIKDITSV